MGQKKEGENGGGGELHQRKGRRIGHRVLRNPPKVVIQTKQIITKQAGKFAKQADEHEKLIAKVTYNVGVASFGIFCFLLGSRPDDIPYLYCLFFITVAPLRWIYYRSKKLHYYFLDFCYYANVIFVAMLLFFPNNDKLFLICFSFSEGPLAWALIVWRCSLVFSSIDKIVSVLIHLLPGTVLFIIRWWDPSTFSHHSGHETGPWPAWPLLESGQALWTWLFVVPLFAYCLWQMLYFLVVNVLRRQRLLRDPEVMTSYRELSRKASRAHNVWWRLCGLLGDNNRVLMYNILQAIFTVATLALTVPIFKSYQLHITFECFKVIAAVWNGGNFFLDHAMPQKIDAKKRKLGSSVNGPIKEPLSGKEPGIPAAVRTGGLDSQVGWEEPVPPVMSKLEKHQVCTLCRRLSSVNLSDLNTLQGNGGLEMETKLGDKSEQPITSVLDVARPRIISLGCSAEFDSSRATMNRSDHVACAS